jgi:hypothetical protein
MVQINAPKYQTAGDHLVMTKKEFIHVLKMSPLLLKQLKEQLKESVNEGKVDRVVGHTRYKYVGDGRKGQAIVSGPMNDREKEAIIKRAKKAGYSAKPNMGGGVTIHVESVNEGSVANKWNIQSQDIGKLQKKTSFSSETSMPFSLISNLSGGVNSTDKGIVSGHFNKDVVILQFYPKEDSRNDTMYDAVDKKGIIAIDKLMKKQYGLSMVSPFLLKGKRHCSADGEVCSVSNYLVFGGANESIEERVNLFLEKNVPTDASKWSYYKSQAKKKFDVYPSAYANGWAAKKYKAAGGGWKTEK